MRHCMRLLLGFVLLSAMICKVFAAELVTTTAKLFYPSLNTVGGNLHGKVTIVEFFDYRCHYCHEIADTVAEIIKTNPNVRVVYRDYPLLGAVSTSAAEAALAAQHDNKYLALQEKLITFKQPLNDTNIVQLGELLGLNGEQLKRNMLSSQVLQQLQENISMAKTLAINGIPTFVIALTPVLIEQKPVTAYVLVSPSAEQLKTLIKQVEQSV